MKPTTFAERYGAREGLSPAELNAVLFRRTLYPHAWPVAWLVRWLRPRHFLADYEFIEEVCHLRSLADFALALGNYVEHPSNRGMLRRRCYVRISARRMLKIVRTVFVAESAGRPLLREDQQTLEPFSPGEQQSPGTAPTKAAPPVP